MSSKQVKPGFFGVTIDTINEEGRPSFRYLTTDCETVREAEQWAETYCWDNGLYYVILEIVDSDGHCVDVVSVEWEPKE